MCEGWPLADDIWKDEEGVMQFLQQFLWMSKRIAE